MDARVMPGLPSVDPLQLDETSGGNGAGLRNRFAGNQDSLLTSTMQDRGRRATSSRPNVGKSTGNGHGGSVRYGVPGVAGASRPAHRLRCPAWRGPFRPCLEHGDGI